MKAVWGIDYDYITDETFRRPMCPQCDAPVVKNTEDGSYGCVSCEEEIELDDDMREWIDVRSEVKIEHEDCMLCGGKNTVETHYVRNRIDLGWIAAWGECKNCGSKFIV